MTTSSQLRSTIALIPLCISLAISLPAAAQGFPGGGFPGGDGGGPGGDGGDGGDGGGTVDPDNTVATDCASETDDAARFACLSAWVDALSAHIRMSGGELQVDGYADSATVATNAADISAIEADYLTSSGLSGYATESYVDGAVAGIDLSGYATQSWVTSRGYLTTSSLLGYATEQWVEEQGYGLASDVADNGAAIAGIDTSGIATNAAAITGIQSDYLTSASLIGYATESYVDGAVSGVDLTGYATESWVMGQGFGLASDIAAIDTSGIATNAAAIAQNTTDIAAVDTSGIAANAAAIAQNATDIAGIDTSGIETNASSIAAIQGDYLTSGDLLGYASEQWVTEQSYGLASDVAQNAADAATNLLGVTQNATDVAANAAAVAQNTTAIAAIDTSGIATNADALASLQAEVDGNDADLDTIMADYLTSASLAGYATQQWVTDQGYSTGGGGGGGVTDLDQYLTVDTDTHSVVFSGANVYVQSGSGYTDDNTTNRLGDGTGSLTGLGNLIVGYDEVFGSGEKTGSHNLVIGPWHTYSSHGGFMNGIAHTVSGPYGSAVGGFNNHAVGAHAVAVGGYANHATEDYSSVTGGSYNQTLGLYSSVSGGQSNIADGGWAAISGGSSGYAGGDWSSVAGGNGNVASGNYSGVSGGWFGTASGIAAAISGGHAGTASGDYSTVSGGYIENATAPSEHVP